MQLNSYTPKYLNERSPMDINNSNDGIQFGTVPSANSMTVWSCQTLSKAIQFILFNNKNEDNKHILTEEYARIFDVIEEFNECPHQMFTVLIKKFTELYDIDLYIINFNGTKFEVFNKYRYLKDGSNRNMAFLSFNEDNTICGPLCILMYDGTTQTIFSDSDFFVGHYVDDYLDELNREPEPTITVDQMAQDQNIRDTQNYVNNATADQTSDVDSQSNLVNSIQADDKAETRALIEQMLKPLSHLFNSLSLKPETINSITQSSENLEHLSHEDTIGALKTQIKSLSTLVENIEQSNSILRTDEIVVHLSTFPDDTKVQSTVSKELDRALQVKSVSEITSVITSSTNLSKTTEIIIETIPCELTPLPMCLSSPKLISILKDEWHSRNMKELQLHKNPLFSPDGAQRAPIQLEVPDESETVTYVGIAILTHDNQDHDSKVAVPQYTEVNPAYILKDNNLDWLEFDEVRSMTTFDRKTRYNYSKITPEEHQNRLKEIRLHIINLYQDKIITKQLIKEKQLNLFKFAFWFCFCEDGKYKRVSPISITKTIREKRIASRTAIKNVSNIKLAQTS